MRRWLREVRDAVFWGWKKQVDSDAYVLGHRVGYRQGYDDGRRSWTTQQMVDHLRHALDLGSRPS